MRKRAREGKALGGWEEERKEFWEIRKWKIEEVEELREKGCLRGEELWETERGMQREERWEKIRDRNQTDGISGLRGRKRCRDI